MADRQRIARGKSKMCRPNLLNEAGIELWKGRHPICTDRRDTRENTTKGKPAVPGRQRRNERREGGKIFVGAQLVAVDAGLRDPGIIVAVHPYECSEFPTDTDGVVESGSKRRPSIYGAGAVALPRGNRLAGP